MRALVLRTARALDYVVDHPDPICPDDGLVIAVEAAGLCRSDVHVWAGGWEWEGAVPETPVVLGHEVAGRIVETGRDVPDADGLRVGDRIAVPFQLSCGGCAACVTGETQHCGDALYTGNSVDGGFAELMAVPRAVGNVVEIPETVGAAAAAALSCRYMTAWRAVRVVGGAQADEHILVSGAGGLGLACIQIASAIGATVIAVEPNPMAAALARAAGADRVLSPSAELAQQVLDHTEGGAHLSVDTSGVADAAVAALGCLARGGRHVQTGLTGEQDRGIVPWPSDRIVMRELRVLGSLGNAHNDYRPLLNLIADGRLDPDALAGRAVSLAEAHALIPTLLDTVLPGLCAVVPSLSDTSKEIDNP